MAKLSASTFFNRLRDDDVSDITNPYIDNYGVSDEFLAANFSDEAFECLFNMHESKMFDCRY